MPAVAPAPGPHGAPPAHIAHAGGTFELLRYSNALEALRANYALGVRWFELDFLPDAQGEWWAVHDWKEAHAALGVPLGEGGIGLPRSQPAGGRYRVATLEQVLGWFGNHEDARLITDTKGENLTLLHQLRSARPELRSRIHPQIYGFAEYGPARAAGLAAPIFTTYRTAYPWWVLRRFVRRAELAAVTVTRAEAREALAALRGEVPLLTHTVNEAREAAELIRDGFSGVYTDELLP